MAMAKPGVFKPRVYRACFLAQAYLSHNAGRNRRGVPSSGLAATVGLKMYMRTALQVPPKLVRLLLSPIATVTRAMRDFQRKSESTRPRQVSK